MRIDHLPQDNTGRINPAFNRPQAWALLNKFNREEFHIHHAETVEGVMRYFALKLGFAQETEFWGMVGLLHDLDFEQYPEQHCIKVQEIMAEEGVDAEIERAVVSHAYGMHTDARPEHPMEKVLFAVDELTGLIGAAILMRPSQSTLDLTTQSLKKKFKDKKFAAGCSRDVILQGAEILGWEPDYLMDETIKAMQEMEKNRV